MNYQFTSYGYKQIKKFAKLSFSVYKGLKINYTKEEKQEFCLPKTYNEPNMKECKMQINVKGI